MMYVQGISHLLEGHLDQADAMLAHACDLATELAVGPLTALTLAERYLVAAERGDWIAADSYARRSLEIVDDGHFDGYWTSALVLAIAARSCARSGDIPSARRLIRRAARLRRLLTYALPVVSVQALIQLANAYIAVVDPGGARAAIEQATAILQQRPHLGNLAGEVEHLRSRVERISGSGTGASSLTAAELRLLPLLPTHLSLPEIGARLFISRHTVKSEVSSIYRKLGVSSRTAAVERISELGLHG
jgi:LuxR family maltose regulon positive regulatory protein